MKTNSKAELLERLAQGNVMYGWGAILAFDRDQVNRMLREQYMAAFNDLNFLLPFSNEVVIGDAEHITLSNIVLGAPQLSFERATFTNSKATVKLNILAGTYSSTIHLPGRPPYLAHSQMLTEEMGLVLEMSAALDVRVGSLEERGRVILDLSVGEHFSCNLGLVDETRLAIGAKLGEQIQAHPAYRQLYSFAMLDFSDYGPLSPVSFRVLTQPAPEGNNPQSTQYGKGAVVVFSQLRMNKTRGDTPGSSFPYLIPDDLTPQGASAYSTTALIAAPLRHFVDDQQAPGILRQLKLPNAHQVSMVDRHDPLDHVIFGGVEPTAQSFFVEPMQSALLPEGRQPFIIDNQGQAVEAQWEVSALDLPRSAGSMTNGTYQALPAEEFKRDQQLILVSGRFPSAAGEQVRTGLLIESLQGVNVLPRVTTWSAGMADIPLRAGSLTDDLDWALIQDDGLVHGELVPDPEQPNWRIFKPFKPDDYVPEVRLQHIRVTNKAKNTSGTATVVIFAYPQTLTVTPFHVPVLRGNEPIEFRLPAEMHDLATWKVFGEGEVQGNVYIPPSPAKAPVSVVMADIDNRFSGYAIVQHNYQDPPIRWTELTAFEIQVRGQPICLANGMQQITLEIVVETTEVDYMGQKLAIPLTPTELSSMRLVHRNTGVEVPFIDKEDDGLAHGDASWATHVKSNRFKAYGAPASSDGPAVRSEDTRKARILWVQSGIAEEREFYARFQSDDDVWWNSLDKKSVVKLQAIAPTDPGKDDYKLTRKRVANIRGFIPDKEPQDPFGYMLESIDYWHLQYTEAMQNIDFATLQFEGGAASVRWESEQGDEVFFSYMCCAFRESPVPGQPDKPAELKEDAMLTAMAAQLKYTGIEKALIEGEEPGFGQLFIVLHRVDNMPFWSDVHANGDQTKMFRAALDKPMMLILRDTRGNRHRLRIGFPPASIQDGRNQVVLSIQ
ncbi:hypothetical protein OO258_22645 [Pseudomonas sp. DCB_BI]|uniref:hypothetical protein n=1 Tax=Pseudomonas sp. DCB_BI TaxID=2993594 RepID=UPI00224A49F9|nr:hypothetical protein [Pseudomonas sp. DCB_BI]MCX2891036.1 hypothetical protein [Pseudomonas sp. DCB_BI]